jgi:hypothetical protein
MGVATGASLGAASVNTGASLHEPVKGAHVARDRESWFVARSRRQTSVADGITLE